jgi:hypothetical protein
MARHRVADVGYGLPVQRIVVNIANKQSRTADKGWCSSFGLGRGTNNSSPQLTAYYEMLHRASQLDAFFGTT